MVYTSVIICLSLIGHSVSKANSWASKTRSARSAKGALESYASLICALFSDIINWSIGHCKITCTKRSRARVF